MWALDFHFDQTADAIMLKLLSMIDEYNRECLTIDVDRAIDADGVVACPDRLAAERGAPAHVRFDHGPNLIAYSVADWCRFIGTETVFIDPGSPWQNDLDRSQTVPREGSGLTAGLIAEDWTDLGLSRPSTLSTETLPALL